MKYSALFLCFFILAVFSCKDSNDYSVDSNEEYQRQLEMYEAQAKKADEQQAETDRQLKRSADLQEQTEAQAERMEKLLERWEKQADRYDAILNKWEKQ